MKRQSHSGQSDWGCDVPRAHARRAGYTRRGFVRNGALALVGTSAVPAFLTRSIYAQMEQARTRGKRLVVIFQRGACDGLHVVVPYAEKNYYALRPTIAIKPQEVLDLDGFFGLHPAMASLKPLYAHGDLAVVHAVGSPDPTRSHFDAQDYMESGTPGRKATLDGWLNRALAMEHLQDRPSSFRAVALGTEVPRTLQGRVPIVSIANLQDFSVAGRGAQPSPLANAFQSMYDESSDTLLHGTGQETFEAVRMLKAANPAQYQPGGGATYPNTSFGNNLKQIAQLLKADLGVEAAFSDVGGWDTHRDQGAAEGQLANRLREFADTLAAFWRDLGDQAEGITVVTMSEFGRTAHQNGTGGTDHGHANVMFVLGGSVQGGKVYGRWPGLAHEQLNEGRDLAVTTDFRVVLGEAVAKTLGTTRVDEVFPGAGLSSGSFLGLLG